MYLGQLLKSTSKSHRKINIHGICFDSKNVKKGDIFFAIEGNRTSGLKFAEEAISKGAAAIVSNKKKNIGNQVPLIMVNNVRKSLSEACSKFYKKKPNNIIAVTGTNGKSSVAEFFYQILKLNKVSVASIGTLGVFSKNYSKKINLTSLDPLLLHKTLEILKKNKIKNLILEASSHGLDQRRLDFLKIKTGIFTNFSHDHLDYHKTMHLYLNAKMHLFKNLLKKNCKIITDKDIKEFNIINKIAKLKNIKPITIGSKLGNLKILSNKYKSQKQKVKISINSNIYNLEIPLIGYFQIKNLFMAVLAASLSGLKIEKILKNINKIKPVSGRLECIASLNNKSNIIIDFAHTPDALEQTLITLKQQFKSEIVIVFGCGGERDKKKRFEMGKIASKYCRKVFITDDNPRNENPKAIRKEIIRGCKKDFVEIENRKIAIQTAIGELKSNEILLVAGKGHEKTQDYGNKIINFSDKQVIKKIIYKKKIINKKNNYSNFLLQKAFNSKKIKNLKYNGVSINTKTIKKNNLFFAISGKNHDGHKFIKEAITKGAATLIVRKKIKKIFNKKIIKVKNTFSALNNLAKVTRDDSDATIIGITGSVGKTTLKNLISFSLKKYGKVYQSPRSYNNKFGVPVSLCNLRKNIDYGVFEIGMDKKGEIDNLSKMVKPEIAIITNISGAHFKNFKSLKDIAKAKAEIINNIESGGDIILNKDDKFFNFLSNEAAKKKVNITSFSLNKKTDIFLMKIKKVRKYFKLHISVKNEIFYFYTKSKTDSFINNILACISTLHILDLDLRKLKKNFITFEVPEGRGDIKIIKKFRKKFIFIDESYNANPLSMSSAINNINYYNLHKNHRKLVFLGDMLELGKRSKKMHRALADIINKSSIDKVFVYGKYIKETFNYLSTNKQGKIFTKVEDAYDHFSKFLHNQDLLMVKGSNATGLNQFSKNIKKGQISAI